MTEREEEVKAMEEEVKVLEEFWLRGMDRPILHLIMTNDNIDKDPGAAF